MQKKRINIPKIPTTARIESLSHDGRGIARIDGKITFIEGALPGEMATFQYTGRKKDFDSGRVISIEEPSTLRTTPKCPHFGQCGGCSLQHVKEEEQIILKQQALSDLFTRIGHTQPQNWLPPLTSAHWNYRTKARLSVRFVEKKQKAMVGFRERYNPRYITEISCCPVLHAKVDKDILALRALIESFDDKHTIAQVEMAAGDKEVALIFRNLNPLNASDEDKLRAFAIEYEYNVFLQPGGEDSVYAFHPMKDSSFLEYALPLQNLSYEFYPTDFTQVNPSLNQKMVELALQLMNLTPDDQVLDLFCGLGNFSLALARHAGHVTGVEGSLAMVERASKNAAKNGLTNMRFMCANLDDIASLNGFLDQKYTKLLLDPPRSGAMAIVQEIEHINPKKIVYVSCDPATLARDTAVLVHEKGYILTKAGIMDMFPHTQHMESIALFEK